MWPVLRAGNYAISVKHRKICTLCLARKTDIKPEAKHARETLSLLPIGPLQPAILVVQNRHAGTQKSHWDRTNKGNNHSILCMPFVGLAPMRLLRPSIEVLYHVNSTLQRAYFGKGYSCCRTSCSHLV